MSPTVVITGIGPLCANGTGIRSLWENLLSQKTFEKPIPESFYGHYNFKSRFYIPAPEFHFADHGLSMFNEKMMPPESRLSAIASKLALQDAGLTAPLSIPDESGVCLGIGMSSLENLFKSYLVHKFTGDDGIKAKYLSGLAYNRLIIPMTMTNSSAAWISILFGLHGAVNSVNASCASGLIAVGQAFQRLKTGECTMMLCGGVEYMAEETGSIMRGFDVLGALTQSHDGRPHPFSKNRSGFLFTEASACMLVLETAESALARGAKIYAQIDDFAQNADAYNIVQINPTGERIEKLMRKLCRSRKIDFLNTHGTGTVLNDKTEAEVIRRVFGPKSEQPFLNANKAYFGHTIATSGVLGTAVAAQCLKEGVVPGSLIPDKMEDLNFPAQNTRAELRTALNVSFGFGGHNAGILLSQFSENQNEE